MNKMKLGTLADLKAEISQLNDGELLKLPISQNCYDWAEHEHDDVQLTVEDVDNMMIEIDHDNNATIVTGDKVIWEGKLDWGTVTVDNFDLDKQQKVIEDFPDKISFEMMSIDLGHSIGIDGIVDEWASEGTTYFCDFDLGKLENTGLWSWVRQGDSI